MILSNRICFIVTYGIVSATTAPSGGEAVTARTFRSGEMIHLFSNHDKIVKHTDGEMTAMDFDGIKVAYTLNKEATVYGLDAAEYAVWIKERPQLTSLGRFNQLKLTNIVHENVYFMDIPPSRIDMIGPLLRLRRAKVNDVLFKVRILLYSTDSINYPHSLIPCITSYTLSLSPSASILISYTFIN